MVGSIFITADDITSNSGGGTVARKESEFLRRSSSKTLIIDRSSIGTSSDPFELDRRACEIVTEYLNNNKPQQIAHIYAGCFTQTVRKLKEYGIRVSYTAAAHDLKESRQEFIDLGYDYDKMFPHMINSFDDYVHGYINADLVICPSKHSAQIMKKFGANRISIIPHGIEHLNNITTQSEFTLGYLGQVGPDKGIDYLLEAWKRANIDDGILILAGKDSETYWDKCNKNNVIIMGYVKHVAYFYKELTHYCQPSVTEGFGMEVIEAHSYGIPTIVSTGCGAVDCVNPGINGEIFKRRDVGQLTDIIKQCYDKREFWSSERKRNEIRFGAAQYQWIEIMTQYHKAWEELCS